MNKLDIYNLFEKNASFKTKDHELTWFQAFESFDDKNKERIKKVKTILNQFYNLTHHGIDEELWRIEEALKILKQP